MRNIMDKENLVACGWAKPQVMYYSYQCV